MILHCVFCDFRDDVPQEECTRILEALHNLCAARPDVIAVHAGMNLDPEGKSPDHDGGLVVSFEILDALRAYVDDPDHIALGTQLVALCNGGTDGIVVYDLEASSS